MGIVHLVNKDSFSSKFQRKDELVATVPSDHSCIRPKLLS